MDEFQVMENKIFMLGKTILMALFYKNLNYARDVIPGK